MKKIEYKNLNTTEKKLLSTAQDAALLSISKDGHKVGAALIDENNKVHSGTTIGRTRIVGSVCAEQMALDNMLYMGNKIQKKIVIIGKLNEYKENMICPPCGRCREMFAEILQETGIYDITFIISSWNKKNIIKTSIKELLPLAFSIKKDRNYEDSGNKK